MVLNRWVQRGVTGASSLREECDSLPTNEQLKFLRNHVVPHGSVGRPQILTCGTFVPSAHSQANGVLFDTVTYDVVKKTFKTSAPCLKRTLEVYGHIRKMGVEANMPLPSLYSVGESGQFTTLVMQYAREDVSKVQGTSVGAAVYKKLRQESIDELVAAGLSKRISHHAKNWCIQKGPQGYRAILIDVGSCSVAPRRR